MQYVYLAVIDSANDEQNDSHIYPLALKITRWFAFILHLVIDLNGMYYTGKLLI